MYEHPGIGKIRELVTLGELGLAIEQLRSLLEGMGSRLRNEGILQSARLVEIERRERQGILSASDAAIQRNQLVLATLDLLDDAARELEGRRGPIVEPSVAFSVPDEVGLEKIFGTNNLKSIAWLRQGLQAARSVCRVVTPTGMGSAFLIEGGQLLTNQHVIP